MDACNEISRYRARKFSAFGLESTLRTYPNHHPGPIRNPPNFSQVMLDEFAV